MRDQQLARAVHERFAVTLGPTAVRLEPLPEPDDQDTPGDFEGATSSAAGDQPQSGGLFVPAVEDLWNSFSPDQRSTIAHLGFTDTGRSPIADVGPREFHARRRQVSELVRLAVIDDENADRIVLGLVELAERQQLARPNTPGSAHGRMDP